MELTAPSRWRDIDFISDLHLHQSDGATFATWKKYLLNTSAQAVFLLGDLFDVWVGDDAIRVSDSFEMQCVDVLRASAKRLALHVMQGNRDFLMGQELMHAIDGILLDDPSVLTFGAERWLLTHGDALCLDDTGYQAFRTTVRGAAWQTEFLSKPLRERQSIAKHLRAQSELHKQSQMQFADVDAAAAADLLQQHRAAHMVHGHTHRPGRSPLPGDCDRTVLSDWDLLAQPPRCEVLRLSLDHTTGSATVCRISPVNAASRTGD